MLLERESTFSECVFRYLVGKEKYVLRILRSDQTRGSVVVDLAVIDNKVITVNSEEIGCVCSDIMDITAADNNVLITNSRNCTIAAFINVAVCDVGFFAVTYKNTDSATAIKTACIHIGIRTFFQ